MIEVIDGGRKMTRTVEPLTLEEGITARVIHGRDTPFFPSPDKICIEREIRTGSYGLSEKRLINIDLREHGINFYEHGRVIGLYNFGDKLKVDTEYGYVLYIDYHTETIEDFGRAADACLH